MNINEIASKAEELLIRVARLEKRVKTLENTAAQTPAPLADGDGKE